MAPISRWMEKQLSEWQKRMTPSELDSDTYKVLYDEEVRRLRKIEMNDAEFQAYKDAVRNAHASLIRQRIEDNDFEGMDELSELMSKLKHTGGNGGNYAMYYFVTVNVKPSVLLPELVKKVEKYVNREMVREAEYVYEQRGSHEGELGKGMHSHILVTQKGTLTDRDFKKNTRNTFKSLVGNPETHVDIRSVKPEHLDDKRSYIQGNKTKEGKAQKVAMDLIWRQKNNLNNYYKVCHAPENPEPAKPDDPENVPTSVEEPDQPCIAPE